MADDLIARIRARLDEDERIARASAAEPWNFYADGQYGAVGEFLDRWNPVDPVRVFADIAAERRILAEHTPRAHGYPCPTCWDGAEDGGPVAFPCPTIRALAGEDEGSHGLA